MINEMTQRKLNNPNAADGAFGVFWDEYRSIEQTPSQPINTDEDIYTNYTKEDYDKNETEIQWLSDVGFTNIAKKIRERKTIDQNDDDMKMITASLTRSQANAVRRRIEYLNDIIQKNHQAEVKPVPPIITQPRKKKDVREVFDINKKLDSSSSPKATVLTLKSSPDRSKSCSVDDGCNKHYHGQRYVSVSKNRLAKAYSDATSPEEPQIVSKRAYSEKNSSPPPIAPKPKDQLRIHGRSQKVISPVQSIQSVPQDVKPQKSPENRKELPPSSAVLVKGRSHQSRPDDIYKRASSSPQSNELGNKSPGQLVFMTGVEREKAINDRSRTNRIRHSAPKTHGIKKLDGVANCKASDSLDQNRRHSALVENKRGETKVYRKTKSVEKSNSEHKLMKQSTVEIDGPASDLLDFDELKMIAIDNNYIDVDDDAFDKLIDYEGISRTIKVDKNKLKDPNENKLTVNNQKISNGTIQSDGSKKQKSKSPQHDIITADQSRSPAASPKDISISRTNDPPISPSTDISVPYTLPTEISLPYNIPSSKEKTRISAISSSSSPTLDNSISIPTTPESIPYALPPSFPSEDVSKRLVDKGYPTSSSPVNNGNNNNNIVKSPMQTQSYSDIENKVYKDPAQTRLNINNLSISSVSQNSELLHSGSDDSKSLSSHGSLGSMGSSDDLHTTNIDNERTRDPIARRLYDECRDQTQASTSVGVNNNSESMNNDQPPDPEGDARLDVGPDTPRDQRESISAISNVPKFPSLPNFSLSKDITGMTEVGDLSDADMERVRPIALIELTALFDAYNIPMNRRKPPLKPKFKDSGVFGVHLTTLSQREENKKHKEGRVPRVFKEMLIFLERHGLKEEGVLRIPGSVARIKGLREAIDKNDLNKVKWEERNVKDVAACLKQFLRDLPEPLLSHEYQNTFISVADLPDRKIQLQALNLLVILLKPVHQKTLKALLSTLNKIIDNEASNKMGLDNVAMIMAPNLLLQSGNKIDIDGQQKAEVMTDIMRMLIKYQSILWTIPSFMVGQIRYVNDSGVKTKDPKTVLKIISKQRKNQNFIYGHKKNQKSSGSSGEELEQFEEEIIRVKAPSLSKQSMAIKLTDDTTANDVIAKFQWRRQNSQKEKDDVDTTRVRSGSKKDGKGVRYHLYECGGNIAERRLEGSANISAILKVNPYAVWLLKS